MIVPRPMTIYEVKRGPKLLGHFLADDIRYKNGTLYAIRNGNIHGSIAGGIGLAWRPLSVADALSERAYRETVGPIKFQRPVPENGTAAANQTTPEATKDE